MLLSQLPIEILKEIFSHFNSRDERAYALCALALTCRRVSDVAFDLLYADIKLVIYGEKDFKRITLLNRSCRENRSLVDRILCACIRLFFGDAAGACNEFLSHLAGSTSLTKLISDFSGKWKALPALYHYREGSFSRVRNLTIWLQNVGGKEGYLPAEEVTRLCELPSLEIFTTHAPIAGFGTMSRPTAMLVNLKHLNFCASHPLSISLLESLFPRTPNLKCLQLNVPGAATQQHRMMSDSTSMQGCDLDEPLRPAFYGELLAPVASSLRDLGIDTAIVKFPSHDGSKIDLSRFTNLIALGLGAPLLFGTGKTTASCGWSLDIWKCLPPRVERLYLPLDDDQGLFWSSGDMRMHARSRTFGELWQQRLVTDHVDWLIGLLDRKRENDASLKTITIAEEPIIDRDQNWKIVQWHMTEHLKAAARAAGVELVIKIRVPRMFESPEFEVCEETWLWGAAGTISYEEEGDDEDLEQEIEE
ncbi:hypothetical protein F4818DRAFT_408858 [Hypoxylon cercidicola]|nr:hypothetical protein F4818DRAFT_408858 [Hypoxylon cercidicola]